MSTAAETKAATASLPSKGMLIDGKWVDGASGGRITVEIKSRGLPAKELATWLARIDLQRRLGVDGKPRVEPSSNAPSWLAALPLPDQPEQPASETPPPPVRPRLPRFRSFSPFPQPCSLCLEGSSTTQPGRTSVIQLRTLGIPSTVTRQSKQMPMPQKKPRGVDEETYQVFERNPAEFRAGFRQFLDREALASARERLEQADWHIRKAISG